MSEPLCPASHFSKRAGLLQYRKIKDRPGNFVTVAGKTQEGRAVYGAPLLRFDFLKFFPICSFQSVCEKRGGKGCHLNGDNAPPEWADDYTKNRSDAHSCRERTHDHCDFTGSKSMHRAVKFCLFKNVIIFHDFLDIVLQKHYNIIVTRNYDSLERLT